MAATVSFRLNKPKDKTGQLKTNPVAILICYYRDGLEVELSSGLKVVPDKFTGTRVAKDVPLSKQINKALSDRESALLNIVFNKPTITKDEEDRAARAIIKGEFGSLLPTAEDPTQKKTSLFTVGRFLAQCKRELDPATVRRYAVLWRALSRFQRGKRLDFSAFDMSFHDRFKNFLYDTPNPNYAGHHLHWDANNGVYIVTPGVDKFNSIGLFDEVVFKYLVQLKTVCEWATKRGYKVHPSHKEWEIIKREYDPITWTLPELEAIEALPPLGTITKLVPRKGRQPSKIDINLDHCRDYISFAARTGPRVSDVKRFDPAQIKQDVWTFTQRKGNRTKINTVSVYLTGYCSQAKLILEKYNYRLPKITETNLNIGIKEVCRRAGITQEMFIERWAGSKKIRITGQKWEFCSSHTCKKSCITIMAGQGIPVPLISQLTGTSEKTIYSNYLGRIDPDKAREYLNKAGEDKTNMRIAN